MAERPYNTMDLKLLTEAVSNLKTISASEADHLVDVVKSLANIYEYADLPVKIFVPNRTSLPRDDIYKKISIIESALKKNKKISFLYTRYEIKDKTLKQVVSKTRRLISPIRLIYYEGNYYIAGFEERYIKSRKENTINEKMFRIDRVRDLTIGVDERIADMHNEEVRLEDFSKKAFNMFEGQKRRVTIIFIPKVLDTMLERFDPNSEEVEYGIYSDNKHYIVTANVLVSDQFFAWICGFRKQAEIIQPAVVREDMKEFLKDISNKY